MAHRNFRSAESYREEHLSRQRIVQFLITKGFRDVQDVRKKYGSTESQTISARSPSGARLRMRVRLCWRPRRQDSSRQFAASQLMARIEHGDWEGSIRSKVERQKAEGITHLLVAKRVGKGFPFVALIPMDRVLELWCAQRDASQSLIDQGEYSGGRKNHAMNGASPTLWLADERSPSVAAALWASPEVINLAEGNNDAVRLMRSGAVDDTLDDLAGLDYDQIGSDNPPRIIRKRSYVRRNPAVRARVLARANGKCERPGCSEARKFGGFLDVHHIFGVSVSDRIKTCVAICPNCHREAHCSPNAEAINRQLKRVAESH